MMKKFITLVVIIFMISTYLTGCGNYYKGQFYFITEDAEEYNENLFYRNDLELQGADPSVIYISDKESSEYGYYYLYLTTDSLLDTRGFCCWKSKDLNTWEFVSVAYYPQENSWSKRNLWAPEVIYDEGDDKYYMFYSARDEYNVEGRNDGTPYLDFEQFNTTKKCLGLAVADEPYGPFEQYVDANHDITTPLLEHFDLVDVFSESTDGRLSSYISLIDASPFIDENGDKYLYFVRSHVGRGTDSVIYGVKMNEWWDPEISTATQLTSCGYRNVYDPNKKNISTEWDESGVNEGPFMLKMNGVYYLTMSINGYDNKLYSVVQALGSSPLGPFEKLPITDGAYVLAAESNWDFASGTGHHSFVKKDGEIWIVYHAHLNRFVGSGQRAIAVDRVYLTKNNANQNVLYANGPTYSIQPLPQAYSGYKNIANQAAVSVKNMLEDSNKKYLTDNLYRTHTYYDFVKDADFNKSGQVTLTFSDYRQIRAIMVVNAMDSNKYFETLKNVELSFKKVNPKTGKTVVSKVKTGEVDFNIDRYQSIDGSVQPSSAVIIEFEELAIKEIKISLPGYASSISEIVILGR